jgi:cytochrome b involved in lipid metabolism
MYKLIYRIKTQTLSIILVGIIALVTLATSAYATVKIAGSFKSGASTIPEVKATQDTDSHTNPDGTEDTPEITENAALTTNTTSNPAVTPIKHPVAKLSSTSTGTTTQTTNTSTTQTTASTASVTNNNKCIVTIFGKRYDVTPLQTNHPGGNIFNCGTDMTAVYQGQHGSNLSRMQPYLMTDSTTTGTSGTSTGGSTNSTSNTGNGGGTNTTVNTKEDNDVENLHEDKQETQEKEDHIEKGEDFLHQQESSGNGDD